MNEQAETKLSTIKPLTERERRARSAARAAIARLVASAAFTAGEDCTIEFGERSSGGGAIDEIRSASLDMAAAPEPLPAGRRAVAVVSDMTPLHGYFSAP